MISFQNQPKKLEERKNREIRVDKLFCVCHNYLIFDYIKRNNCYDYDKRESNPV